MSQEQYRVSGDAVVSKIKEIIKEGNARKIIIKNEKDKTLIEFPLTIGAVGVMASPVVAAIGALVALVTNCTIVVEKKKIHKK